MLHSRCMICCNGPTLFQYRFDSGTLRNLQNSHFFTSSPPHLSEFIFQRSEFESGKEKINMAPNSCEYGEGLNLGNLGKTKFDIYFCTIFNNNTYN